MLEVVTFRMIVSTEVDVLLLSLYYNKRLFTLSGLDVFSFTTLVNEKRLFTPGDPDEALLTELRLRKAAFQARRSRRVQTWLPLLSLYCDKRLFTLVGPDVASFTKLVLRQATFHARWSRCSFLC